MMRISAGAPLSFLVILVASSLLFGVSAASAEERTEEDLIARGVELRRRGDDAEALASFERAYAQRPTPRALGQIALAHQALGEWREAERALQEALRSADDPWIVRQRALLDESLAAIDTHLAWLEVETDARVGEVWIDGELRGRLPLDRPLRVAAGEHVVALRVPGNPNLERVVRTDAQTRVHEAFALSPQPSTGSPQDVAPSGAPQTKGPSTRRTAGWVVLAGAGALLAGGVVATVVREEQAAIYNNDSRCFVGAAWRDDQCGSHRDAAATAQALAIVAYAGSAAATIVSITLLASKDSSAPSTGAAASVTCGMRGIGLLCGGAF